MSIVQAIFDAFGGPTKLADAMSEAVSTVHSWKDAKSGIPPWRRPMVLDAARHKSVDLPLEVIAYLNSREREAA